MLIYILAILPSYITGFSVHFGLSDSMYAVGVCMWVVHNNKSCHSVILQARDKGKISFNCQ